MKSSKIVIQQLITDCGQLCSVSVKRDIIEVSRRIEHEGESFLTITLPELSSGLERALERGSILPSDFPHFKCVRSGSHPEFLRGFFSRVFDGSHVRTNADTRAIACIRQISLSMKKIFEVCDQPRVDAQLRKYVEVDQNLPEVEASLSLKRAVRDLFGSAIAKCETDINQFSLPVQHGPGATADKLVGNEKFVMTSWHERLEDVFPYGEYVLPNWRYFMEHQPEYLDVSRESPVKVTPVPKTKLKPRLIAIEPTVMQYAQQGIMRSLVPLLEGDASCKEYIGFTDQYPNQVLAQRGSEDRSIATLDLSDASDRVSWRLVQTLFEWWPDFLAALDVTRSRNAKLPNGDIIPLKKFASMGSAVCFPVEAMVFTAIAFSAIADEIGSRIAARRVCDGRFRVYGDDIIVPVEYTEVVVRALESYGLQVNSSKSFSLGLFRESCGADFYAGDPVNPVYFRVDVDATTRSPVWFGSLVSTANQLAGRGMTGTAELIRHLVESVIGPLPSVDESSAGLGWTYLYPECLPGTQYRWNEKLHRYEVKTYVLKSPGHRYEIDGPYALRKCLVYDWSDPMYEEHLLESGRSSCVSMNKRWIETDVL